MHLSCKISNSVISYLSLKGEDLSSLYEHSFLPVEMMQDSSYWMSAHEMETFLEQVCKLPMARTEANLLEKIGHNVSEIRAWGVLDSVLRMMPRPQEIFNKPERFLSYFISPEPPIENLIQTENSISFDLPLHAEQYPLVTTYLRAAFESLPLYVGQGLASCQWQGIHLKIDWQTKQESIFHQDPGHQISPVLLENVVEELQKHQLELEEKNRELQRKNEELQQAHKDLQDFLRNKTETLPKAPVFSEMTFDNEFPGRVIGQNLSRLHDYMVRAQQLITMLAAQGKNSKQNQETIKQTQEAMRRVDWEFVKTQYPRIISESFEVLRKIQNNSKENLKDNLKDNLQNSL